MRNQTIPMPEMIGISRFSSRLYGIPRSLLLTCMIIGMPAITHAFDLGDALKQFGQPEVPNPGTPKEGILEKETDKKKVPSITDLADFVKGTSTDEEVAIGQEIAGRLLGAAPLVQDERLQQYVNKVGRWVSLHSGREDLDWHFGVLDSEDINAFAAPGGFIFLTKGLYRQLNSEAELAGVLGHEIGHVVKQHHLNLLKKSKAIDMGSSLFSKKLGKMKNEQAKQTVQSVIGSGAEIMARGLDKDAEFEADRIGVVVAARAGYDAYGLPRVLQEIGHGSLGDSSVALLFKTHPHPDTRLTQLGDSMGEKFDAYSGNSSETDGFYRLGKN